MADPLLICIGVFLGRYATNKPANLMESYSVRAVPMNPITTLRINDIRGGLVHGSVTR